MKARALPKRLKLVSPLIVIDVDEDKIVGWFSNIAGAYKVGMKIEKFAREYSERTRHSVVLATGHQRWE